MARPKGLLQVNGSLGELSFYDSVYGPIVRRKGGPSAEKIAKGKNFERVREHNAEFKGCALAGKILRLGLNPLLKEVKDHRLVWRVTQLMSALKNLDQVSARGKRTAMQGLASEAGKALLKNFDFNSQATLKKVLLTPFTLDPVNGVLTLKGLKPAHALKAPKGATHAGFKSAWLKADLVNGRAELFESEDIQIRLDKKANDVVLVIAGKPNEAGIDVFLLRICFLQEINGIRYLLNNGAFTALGVAEVI